jgi:hypothetical protein
MCTISGRCLPLLDCHNTFYAINVYDHACRNGKTNPHLHSLETKKITSYDVGYPGPSMGHTKHVAKLNRLMGLLPLKKTKKQLI